MITLRLEPFGEVLIAAKRLRNNAALQFNPHLSR